jgi:hypothetical protein
MAERRHTEASGEIEVLATVHVPDAAALRLRPDHVTFSR